MRSMLPLQCAAAAAPTGVAAAPTGPNAGGTRTAATVIVRCAYEHATPLHVQAGTESVQPEASEMRTISRQSSDKQ